MKRFYRFIPLGIIAALIAFVYLSGLHRGITFETIRYHHFELSEYVNNNPIMTPFMFMAVLATVTIPLIPGRLILSLLGGFLFPDPWNILYLLIGTTAGALIVFLSAKKAIGSNLPRLKRIEMGFNRNAVSYLLFLRLFPLLPFWFSSLIPALFNTRLRTFIWTTFVGSIPGALLITSASRGLNIVFETSEEFSARNIFNPEALIFLCCLALLALLPILAKRAQVKKRELE